MGLRIAIGPCSCRRPFRDEVQRLACECIDARRQSWRERLPADLSAVPESYFESELLEGHAITFATSREQLESGDVLVVFQALVHTWSKPTYFTLGAVGRMFAEGLVVRSNGAVEDAPDELLWHHR